MNIIAPQHWITCLHHCFLPTLLRHILFIDTYLDDSLDIAMTFGEIFGAKLWCSLTMLRMGLENTSGTFTLGTNNTTHLDLYVEGYERRSKFSLSKLIKTTVISKRSET